MNEVLGLVGGNLTHKEIQVDVVDDDDDDDVVDGDLHLDSDDKPGNPIKSGVSKLPRR